MKRPLPKSWPDRVREKLRQVARDNPDLHITVTPRHRISGPHPAGDTWHTPEGQKALNELLGDHCADCGRRVIRATGDLLQGLYCGPCMGARDDAANRLPPAGAA